VGHSPGSWRKTLTTFYLAHSTSRERVDEQSPHPLSLLQPSGSEEKEVLEKNAGEHPRRREWSTVNTTLYLGGERNASPTKAGGEPLARHAISPQKKKKKKKKKTKTKKAPAKRRMRRSRGKSSTRKLIASANCRRREDHLLPSAPTLRYRAKQKMSPGMHIEGGEAHPFPGIGF